MSMTDFTALKQELNGDTSLKEQYFGKSEHGPNGKHLVTSIPENQDQRRALEQNGDSLDLPHMDTPSPLNSPVSSTIPNKNISFATSTGSNVPTPISSPSYSPSYSPAVSNGISAAPHSAPPYSPSLINLQANPPFPPLSPNILNIPPTSNTPSNSAPFPTSNLPTSVPPSLVPTNTIFHHTVAPPANHIETPKPPTPSAPLTPPPSLTNPTPPTNLTPLSSLPSSATVPPPHTTATATIATPNSTGTTKPAAGVATTPRSTVGSTAGSTAGSTPSAMHTQLQLEKAQKDLARLRQHLMEMEEQHTLETEAMAEKIAQLESATQQNEKKGSSQDSTIQNLTATNERLSTTLKERELDLETTTAALYNLQNVLSQFQAQREEDIKNETQTLRNEAARANQQAAAFKKERDALQEKVKRVTELEELTRTLQHELTEKTRTILTMQEEVEPLRRALNQSAERLSQMAQYEQNLVEKSVVTKLIVTYLSAGKKQEVLSLMARILNFTEEEMQKVGLLSSKGWIPFLRTPSSSSLASSRGGPERSVGDLWMEFLLKEVGEQPPAPSSDGKNVVP